MILRAEDGVLYQNGRFLRQNAGGGEKMRTDADGGGWFLANFEAQKGKAPRSSQT